MERLTFVDEDGQVLFDNPAGFPEDVGFTIRELAENEEWKTLDDVAERLANCEQRLKHYEDLEEQGRLLKLPCAVGDTVYSVTAYNGICEHEIRKFQFDKCGWSACSNLRFPISDFGKTIFLTRQEAEDKLKLGKKGAIEID